MRRHAGRCINLFSLVLIIVISLPAASAVHEYVEDFTTKDYWDAVNTTAHWDTLAGELKLYPFEIALAGSCDTPGDAWAVAVAGDYAYVADAFSGLRVIDISDPANPVLAGSCDTPDRARGVAISGDHAYVADEDSGLQVIDISDPTNPVSAGSYDTPGAALAVAVAGDYAYMADWGSGGLQVIDISDPTAPGYAGSYDSPGSAYDVAIAGDYAYLADGAPGLQVIDISDPTSPALVGSYNTPGNALAVALAGDYAYVADYTSGLRVIDISDPTTPVSAGSCDTPSEARGVVIAGDYAYVADHNSGLQAMDISDPTSPVSAGSCDTPGLAYGVVIAGDYAYVADLSSGLQVVRVSDSVDPVSAGSCSTSDVGSDVAISGDYAYVAADDAGLVVIDISDPTGPVPAGSYVTPGGARGVAIAGDHAYVADFTSGLQVIDISDPTAPAYAGSHDTPYIAYGVAVSGDYAYVADYDSLQVIDISDPTSPVPVGSYDTPGDAGAVAIAGDYAYVTCRASGLQVIDISDPATPVPAGSYVTPGRAYGVAIAGDYAYVADEDSGLQVIDVSDPTTPVPAGSYDTPSFARSVAIAGDRAYLAEDSGLRVIDISDPTTPTLVGSHDTPAPASDVAVAGDYAYVLAYTSGLQVIEVFQRALNLEANTARSLDVEPSVDEVPRARLSSTQMDSIRWELSADGGTNWDEVLSGGSWHQFASPGSDLRWRSTHVYAGGRVNPACSNLSVGWLYGHGIIDAVADVPEDQGGWVRVFFTRSGHDFVDAGTPIVDYYVWSRVDSILAARALSEGAAVASDESRLSRSPREDLWLAPLAMEGEDLRVFDGGVFAVSGSHRSGSLPPGTWEVIGRAPGVQQDDYVVRVPTVGDSSAGGAEWTVLCVTAHTATPSIWYASPPDSGYSVDNIAPGVPSGFALEYHAPGGNDLAWEVCEDEDFQYFSVYRDDSEGFEPGPGNLVHTTIDLGWLDPDGTGWDYYKITARDHAGNESDPASPESVTGVDDPGAPARFALHRSAPNPLRSGTVIAYDVPVHGGEVRLTVYNVAGRRVRALVDGPQTAGRKSATWDGRDDRGNAVGSGVYYCRLEASGYEQSIKITVLR